MSWSTQLYTGILKRSLLQRKQELTAEMRFDNKLKKEIKNLQSDINSWKREQYARISTYGMGSLSEFIKGRAQTDAYSSIFVNGQLNSEGISKDQGLQAVYQTFMQEYSEAQASSKRYVESEKARIEEEAEAYVMSEVQPLEEQEADQQITIDYIKDDIQSKEAQVQALEQMNKEDAKSKWA